jgi:hypothetical protein
MLDPVDRDSNQLGNEDDPQQPTLLVFVKLEKRQNTFHLLLSVAIPDFGMPLPRELLGV